MQKEIQVPFMGFYETIASELAEQNAFLEWEKGADYCDVSEMPDDLQNEFYDWYSGDNYKKYTKEVADNYLTNFFSEIHNHTDIDLRPAEKIVIDSPREYNFTTDRLFCTVDQDKLIKLYNRMDQTLFAEKIKDKFTSRDGFSSFYDNDINDPSWQDPANYDHNQWETVFETLIDQFKIDEYQLYYN